MAKPKLAETETSETETPNLPAVESAAGYVTVCGRQVRVARRITARTFSMEDHTIYVLRFDGPVFQAEPLPAIYNPKNMPPPYMVDICDRETGECARLICNKVLVSELDRNFGVSALGEDSQYGEAGPFDTYIGRTFQIIRAPAAKEAKDYKVFDIQELDF